MFSYGVIVIDNGIFEIDNTFILGGYMVGSFISNLTRKSTVNNKTVELDLSNIWPDGTRSHRNVTCMPIGEDVYPSGTQV